MARKLSDEEAEAIAEQFEDNKMDKIEIGFETLVEEDDKQKEDTVEIFVDAELKNGEEYTQWFERDRSDFNRDKFTSWYMDSNPSVVEMTMDTYNDVPLRKDYHKDEGNNMDELKEISGVDQGIAQKLYHHGYYTESEIRKAEQMELAGIEGIGNALAARMKADVGDYGSDNEDEEDGMSVSVAENVPLTFTSNILGYAEPKLHLSDDDVPIEVGDDVDEIVLMKDGEEVDVDVSEVFGEEEEMECTCNSNQMCSECSDERVEELKNAMPIPEFSKSNIQQVGGDLEVSDIGTGGIVEELEEGEKGKEDRAVCASPYCEQWADSCDKHGDAF